MRSPRSPSVVPVLCLPGPDRNPCLRPSTVRHDSREAPRPELLRQPGCNAAPAAPVLRRGEGIIFQAPTDSDIRLIRAAGAALFSIYREGCDYEKASVWLGRLSSAEMAQLSLFSGEGDRGSALSRAADRLNGEAGRRLLMPAALLGEKPGVPGRTGIRAWPWRISGSCP